MHQVSRAQARSFVVGVGSVVVLSLVVYLAMVANEGRVPGTPTTTVKAAFADIGQLQTGSEVRQNGIRIGQVSAIEAESGQAVVTMALNGAVPLYADATAAIYDQSALAQKFVQLSPGASEAGELGDQMIPTTRTESTHDLVEVLDAFPPTTRAALGTTLRSLGGGVAGYGDGLHDFVAAAPALLDGVGTIATTLSARETNLPATLRSADRLTTRFEGREQQITALLAQTDQTMQALGVDDGAPLDQAFEELPATLVDTREAFAGLQPTLDDIDETMTEIRDGARALGDATPDTRGILREAVAPLDAVPGVADSAEPAVVELTSVFSDARPFTPRVAEGLASAAEPLAVLAPYAQDIGMFSFDISNLIENHNGWTHHLRIATGPPTGTSAVVNNLVEDYHNPYPAPGEAVRDRAPTGGLIPGTEN